MPSCTKEVSPVKDNGKLYSRARAFSSKDNKPSGVLSEEPGETSFRVYYGATGAAVPFMWESQPGTPKHPIFNKSHDGNDGIVPPLTPPPSYTSSPSLTFLHTQSSLKPRKARFLDAILSSFSRKSSHVSPTSTLSSPLSWSTSSSSSSMSSPPRMGSRKGKSHRRSATFCSSRAKSPLFGDEDHACFGSPSAMCFGLKKTKQGCYSMQDVKDAIFQSRDIRNKLNSGFMFN